MTGFLIGEEGPLTGLILRFENAEEWVLGRDPDEVDMVLEDPMVSRKHVICKLTPEGYVLENLSSVNPITQNGKVVMESVLLREGDIIQIGSTFFRFSEKEAAKEPEVELLSVVPEEDLSTIQFDSTSMARWLLKVVSGPNAGAEFSLRKNASYTLGKDPNLCDIVFQDLSVSRQHAKLSVDDQEQVFIEDLGSRNGVLVNGMPVAERQMLASEDLVALGTTAFLVIDREQVRETIVSPPSYAPMAEGMEGAGAAQEEMLEEKPKDWRETVIPKKLLLWGGVCALFILMIVVSMISLMEAEPVVVSEKNESKQIKEKIEKYPDVQFSFNDSNGSILIVGHVLTAVDKQELLYLLKSLSFIQKIDDNVVVDEYVWQNMNALVTGYPDWQGISFSSPQPGRFVMRGYLQTLDQLQALEDYVNMNFPYVDRLENQVIVENNLSIEVDSILIEKGFSGVNFELKNGDLVLAGMVDAKKQKEFGKIVDQLKGIQGIRQVKNYVIYASADSSRVDLSDKYQVTGSSKKDDTSAFVVVNGRIVSQGDTLDGMLITAVLPDSILLEKAGVKYKINYNQQ